MTATVLFLETDSAYKAATHADIAVATVKQLIQTLRSARRVNSKISLNSEIRLPDFELSPGQTLGMLLSGKQYRDEWSFLRELASKSPFSSGFEQWLNQAELTEAKITNGQISFALTWANLLETGIVSFHVQSPWTEPWIDVELFSISDSGEEIDEKTRIRNASLPAHIESHQDWLKMLGYEKFPTANQFWIEKESRFQGLRFLDRVKSQLENLFTSGVAYKQALNSLELLNNDALEWLGDGLPGFSIKIADGEHDQRRHLSMFEDEFSKGVHDFSRHAYFTGGIPGRIHFRLATDERKFVVAHVGFKLY